MVESKLYTTNEVMAVAVSRELADDELGYMGTATGDRAFTIACGIPIVAARIAQLSHAPGFSLFWNNVLDPELEHLPATFSAHQLVTWPCAAELSTSDGNDMLAKNDFAVSFVSAAQVDRYGNMNITVIGNYSRPKVRLVGCLAQTELLAYPRKPICIVDMDKRVFVEKVDYVTGVGHLFGGDSREKAGLRPGGTWRVITDKAVFGFHPQTKEMVLLSVHPGVRVQEVLDLMSFRPLFTEPVPETDPPTDEQVRLIRETIDPNKILLRG